MTDGAASTTIGPSVSIDGPAWALFLGRRRPAWRALATWIISAVLSVALAAFALHLLTLDLSIRDAPAQAATVVSVSGGDTREPLVRVQVQDGPVVPLTLQFEPTPEVGQRVEVATFTGPPPYAVLTTTDWLAWAEFFLLASVCVGIYAVWQFVLWRRITARAAAEA